NLAEFLSLPACQAVEAAVTSCKKRRLREVSSESLLYTLVRDNKDIQILVFRLGIDRKKLEADLRNYLEKQERVKMFNLQLSGSFQKTIEEAAVIAFERKRIAIGEKELLVALARQDGFFKNVLMEHDLKETDVQNITLWLDSLEEMIAKSRQFWKKEHLLKYGSLGKDFASGFTINLDRFSIDWRRITGRHLFNGIIGHKKEVDELEAILAKSNLSNALILGEAGIGRKSIVQSFAQRCFLGMSLPELNNRKVVELDMVALLAQIQGQDQLEIMLSRIFSEVMAAGNIILVIDNFEHFVDSRTQKAGTADISGILSKYLAMPDFHFIAIASMEGFHRKIEQDPAFLNYFSRLEVSEISEIETIRILEDLALGMETKYKILITYPAIREIVNLSGRYFPSIPFPKKAIDVLDESVSYLRSQKEKVLFPQHIAKVISEKTNIPVGKMEFKEKSVLLNLENLIHEKIINQAEAVKEISIAMRRSRSGLGSKKRPMGSFLFLGPTGVGKTETAKALVEIYFGGIEKMIRLDMSEFQALADIPRLLGSVSPVEQQGLLTTPVRERPFSLILMDEIEKAHPDILNLFLQVLDEGHITDGQGRKVMFTNTIIICTSNAGAQIIFEEVEKGGSVEKEKLMDFLFTKSSFRPEFINRFDATVIFHPLTRENLLDIAQLSCVGLAKNLKEKDIELVITEALKEKIVELSYKPEFGAREMRRVMQDTVENSIAKALLAETITKGDKIEINPDNFEVVKIQ
ncbi:MAG TPA: ATP-dependent Clp protease ATP-binding subunit, partial [Negativicutes bacterium]|nr:ATP-dependent Clp protease ATP-binding subunit [Negativicutes bacterium]